MPDDLQIIIGEVTTVVETLASDFKRTGYRAGGSSATVHDHLGLLGELPGTWRGSGLNITARPFFRHGPSEPPFFLEINATRETLDFKAIAGDIPNRGSQQPDINLHGVRYLQQVIDANLDTGIHIEPGLWIRVPPTAVPDAAESYVRQSTIPHGDSLLAQTVKGGPQIEPVDSTPFTDPVIPGLNKSPNQPINNDKGYLDQYRHGALPKGLPPGLSAADVLKDPTIVLRAAIDGQTIDNTVVLVISTVAPGSLINIPFVTANANATQLDAIFWIESVKREDGQTFMQLQYVQRVILDFIGIH